MTLLLHMLEIKGGFKDKRYYDRAREKTWTAEYLPCKHKNPSSNSRIYVFKRRWKVMCTCNLITGETEIGGTLELSGQLS